MASPIFQRSGTQLDARSPFVFSQRFLRIARDDYIASPLRLTFIGEFLPLGAAFPLGNTARRGETDFCHQLRFAQLA